MSKGLEALGRITGTQNLTMYEQNECLNIIEKELKEGEKNHKLKIDICEYFGLDDLFPYDDNSKIMEKLKEIQNYYYDIQFKKSKKEKALEIIKKTRVDTNLIKLSKDYDDYCAMEVIKILDNTQTTNQKGITEEEYDLLKKELFYESNND